MLDNFSAIMHQLTMTEQQLRSTQQPERAREPIRRTLIVLDWLCRQPQNWVGVLEIAAGLGMQPSTISRLLKELQELGLVRRDPASGRYGVGLELVRLGALATAKLDIAVIARPHLAALTAASGESSYLGLYDPGRRQMMRVETVPSPNPLRYVVAMHQWVDVVRGASGKAILAFLPPGEAQEIVDDLVPSTEATPFLEQLAGIRARGYACTRGQRTPGAVGVGAPIFDSRGEVAGDVFITIPESRFDPASESRLGELVLTAAQQVTRDIAGKWPLSAEGGAQYA